MGFIFSKSMSENMKNQQEFMLMNARLQLERQLMMQNEMRERQMALQIAWSREFLKYFGTFFGIAAISLTAGAIRRKKPAFLFPIIPLSFVFTYQYDLGYGTLLQRMKEVLPSSIIHTKTLNTMVEHIPNFSQELKAALSDREPSIRELQLEMESSNLNLEELKKAVLSGQNETEDKSLSEFENSGLDKHSRKKRQFYVPLSDKCCNVGCTRKELSAQC
ncbi:plasminogen receptor (KT) isoform X1 [Mustela putorius furo]|uniref:Plasminogen receptor (KT) isoform X1 n=2 Tax=Mustela putorius furo TaxID=9669 RepID=A0A8U0NYZ8_MUSPF|nr:plasminogen receptor (KT) isoform X1 [Mustela putorius furo]XP_012918832.1 plasminogen receptor (KT) isoform X1 [Mustela putorius furo]